MVEDMAGPLSSLVFTIRGLNGMEWLDIYVTVRWIAWCKVCKCMFARNCH